MKVILNKPVLHLGIPGDVINVKPGYAFNYLIPNKLAMFASEENIEAIEVEKASLLANFEAGKKVAENLKESVSNKAILLEKQVNEAGNFYSTVSPQDVLTALLAQYPQITLEVNKNNILVSNKIRNYGIYDVTITLYHGVSAKMKLSIAANTQLAADAVAPKTEEKTEGTDSEVQN